jgi:alpha-ribazole phosphatase
MRTVTFVRHGQSLANAGGITVAHHAIPLTDLGRRQAEWLALALPGPAPQVLVSSFERAQDTAAPYLKRHGLSARTMDALREFESFDARLLAGMNGEQRRPVAEAYWAEGNPERINGEGAESYRQSVERVAAFQALELPGLADGTVVFGHGMWMGKLIWRLLGFTAVDSAGMKAFRRFQAGLPMPNGAAYRLIEQAGGGWRVQADEALMRQLASLPAGA